MQKKDKFRSHALYGHLEGYGELPKSGDSLVIASGRKDSMAFNVIGYPSVAPTSENTVTCLLYTSDAADERSSVDLGGRRIITKKKIKKKKKKRKKRNYQSYIRTQHSSVATTYTATKHVH